MDREGFNSMVRLNLVRIGKGKKANLSPKAQWVTVSIITVFVLAFFILISIPAAIEVNEENIKISGLYGDRIPTSDIVSVDILEKMPPIRKRLNGSDAGRYLKGHFMLKNEEKCKIFIRRDLPPFIELRTKDNLYYFNMRNSEDTRTLFGAIKQTRKEKFG